MEPAWACIPIGWPVARSGSYYCILICPSGGLCVVSSALSINVLEMTEDGGQVPQGDTRKFNVDGLCVPEPHYTLPAQSRLPEARKLIDEGRYFSV